MGDYSGGFGGQRGNFNNQGMPMNQMGMGNQAQMINYQQNQQPQQQMMGNPLPVVNPQGMRSPHHMATQQQQQMNPLMMRQAQQMNPGLNAPKTLSLQTPTAPTAPFIGGDQNSQPMQQQQQPQPQQPQAAVANTQNQQGSFIPTTLCKFAQETLQEIVCRFQEIFQTLRSSNPPNGTAQPTVEKKVQEQLRSLRLLFRRLMILYTKCNEVGHSMEYTQVESLIPFKDEMESRPEPPQSEEYKKAVQENQELLEQLTIKNKQLREVIDRLRITIWEINTMLSMRRS